MDVKTNNTSSRKLAYTYTSYSDLGRMLLSFMVDLIVMLTPMAIWDAVMIGILGSVFSISGLNIINGMTVALLMVSAIVLNPLIYSYTRGQSLGMKMFDFYVMHKSGRRCNLHVIRTREIAGFAVPFCVLFLLRQPLLIPVYYIICGIVCAVDPKHRTPIDFILQTCIMKADGSELVVVEQEPKCRYDFHIHSSFSRNGEKSVEDIFAYAQANKMEMISITDVNTVKHNPIARTLAARYNIRYLSGIELKAKVEEHVVSILGYAIDYRDEAFVTLENACLLAEKEASLHRINAFSHILGKPIDAEAILNSQRFPKISGETIAKYVLSHPEYKDCPILLDYREMDENLAYKKLALKYFYVTKDANGRYISGACYAEENYPKLKTVLELIEETGGCSVLADACGLYQEDKLLFEEVLHAGVDGLEIYRPDIENEAVRKEVIRIAKEKELYVFCGSDFYAEGKGRMIGECGKISRSEEEWIASGLGESETNE